jgi:rubrerythrin
MKRVIPAYKTLVDVLQDAIDKEADAEQFYAEASELAQTPEVKRFLLELAEMERQHFVMLSEKLEELKADRQVMDGILSSYDEQLDDR